MLTDGFCTTHQPVNRLFDPGTTLYFFNKLNQRIDYAPKNIGHRITDFDGSVDDTIQHILVGPGKLPNSHCTDQPPTTL